MKVCPQLLRGEATRVSKEDFYVETRIDFRRIGGQ
jgi:hypothetical protein